MKFLVHLNIRATSISDLDFLENSPIKNLAISGTQITHLNTENLISMTELYIEKSLIKKIDLSSLENLCHVTHSDNQEVIVRQRV